MRVTETDAKLNVTIDGRPLTSWQGLIASLDTHADWKLTEHANRIQLGANLDPSTTLTFQKAMLKPLTPPARMLRAAVTDEIDLLAISTFAAQAAKRYTFEAKVAPQRGRREDRREDRRQSDHPVEGRAGSVPCGRVAAARSETNRHRRHGGPSRAA